MEVWDCTQEQTGEGAAGQGCCYFQVRPERASLVLKVTQPGNGSQPGLCPALPCPSTW